ncbi:MAG: threonine/serine dehydratase [Planctomycetes bacterium]|nr:threonine/serine dehydratase [Planctomycetota bacterium]
MEPALVHPVTIDDVLAAEARIRPFLPVTPLREYAPLNLAVGDGITVLLKHENHQPTNAFKVRNALSALSNLPADARRRGVVAASRGNHGLGLAWAGKMLGIPVTICVPHNNNLDKNIAIRGLGARLVERGRDYDEAIGVAQSLVEEEGLVCIHSTNNADVIAGAATVTLEMLKQYPEFDALVIAVGGGSVCAGAIIVAKDFRPDIAIYAVQAEGASAIHDSWRARRPLTTASATTIADGLATRSTYEYTYSTLLDGLDDFITVNDEEIADAMRIIYATTHNLCEPAGAAGLAGLIRLRQRLQGKRVGVVLTGSNVDWDTLKSVVSGRPCTRVNTRRVL